MMKKKGFPELLSHAGRRSGAKGRQGRAGTRGLGRRAAAMVEFACASPLLVILLGGAHDLGLAQYSRISIANAVAAGAEYAYLVGSGYDPTTSAGTASINALAALVGTIVIRATPQVAPTQAITTSTVNGVTTLTAGIMTVTVTGPNWSCISAPDANGNVTLSSTNSSGATYTSTGPTNCADGSKPGLYVVIDARYSNTGLMAGFMSPSTYVVAESARVLLQ